MKKLIILTSILFFGLANTGCDPFLEEEPRGVLQTGNFYNNDNEALLASNGLYRILHKGSLYRTRGLDNYYVSGCDLVGPSRNVNGNIHNYLIDEGVADGNATWGALYEIVRNASDLIARAGGNENLSENVRNQVLGEAYFLRALAYFHLTNLWGNVPYFRELLPLQELSTIERFSKDEIKADMKADLELAFDLLPASYGDAELGRATKWAAKTLQAKFYLFDQEWQLALDACNEIIDNSPHRLLDDFAEVFNQTDPTNQYKDEHIFVVDFTTEGVIGDAGTSRTDDYTPRGSRDEPAVASLRSQFLADLDARGEEMTGFAWAVPLPQFANQSNWDPDDLRYDATIVTEYIGYQLQFPYFRKNWNVTKTSPRFDHHENYIVFRLADIYLMAAEAENELNGPNNAYTYVNTVRERAFEPDKPWSGLSEEQFRLNIRDERKFELAAEGHRKMDLIRWGILLDVVRSVQHRPFNNPAANIQPKHVLLPIPQQELLLNPNLLNTDPTNNGYR
ncbi:RagB/SusD family nutrient uptake outer membrane protein [Seonamhaeicola sp.]|uniref:RagB/SusD family nutrient uptake outer membrane protein n=1 Tax=Seonamhaeicola sp. TaxID=1912245 RepID=UPI0026165007|nr:RagB/SusD family nutrient uptake outer membrane protein [Seonamhaeicola sp.]